MIYRKSISPFCIMSALFYLILPTVAQPIKKNPDNPHYLHYKDEPILLITSAEHYGAVINLDFDYGKYLQTLHDQGMNYTRIFTGSYVELPGSFGIGFNTLSPAKDRFIAPWPRVSEPGLYENEGKFDLSKWNPVYFERLHNFMSTAASLDIIVEVTFFCATYQDNSWERHPFNEKNNINDLGEIQRRDFNTLKNEIVVHFQKQLVEKLTQELNRYDNLFFEICNEPWADNGVNVRFLHKTLRPKENSLGWLLWATSATPATLAWQKEIAKSFRMVESNLPKRHLLAQNYSNFWEILTEVDEDIDILNFHYAWPESVEKNYGWKRPVNFDESGFAGTHDTTYLQEAWAFMLSGGAIFNNLDYSFYVGKEDGSGVNDAPGGGSANFRRQISFMREFLSDFSYVDMKPSDHLVVHCPGLETYCLANHGIEYAIYAQGRNQGQIELQLESGTYSLKIYDPDNGELLKEASFEHATGTWKLEIPKLNRIAISVKK